MLEEAFATRYAAHPSVIPGHWHGARFCVPWDWSDGHRLDGREEGRRCGQGSPSHRRPLRRGPCPRPLRAAMAGLRLRGVDADVPLVAAHTVALGDFGAPHALPIAEVPPASPASDH